MDLNTKKIVDMDTFMKKPFKKPRAIYHFQMFIKDNTS